MVSSLPLDSCWIQSQGSLEIWLNAPAQMTKPPGLVQEKAHLMEMAQKMSFLLFLPTFLHRNFIGLSISSLRTLLRSRCGFCSLGHFVLCILSKSVASTIHRLGKASPCTDVVDRSLFFSSLPEE